MTKNYHLVFLKLHVFNVSENKRFIRVI